MSNGRDWCPQELAALRRMALSGSTDAEIGEHIDRHPKVVGRKRRELRLQPGRPPALRIITARLILRRLQLAA